MRDKRWYYQQKKERGGKQEERVSCNVPEEAFGLPKAQLFLHLREHNLLGNLQEQSRSGKGVSHNKIQGSFRAGLDQTQNKS